MEPYTTRTLESLYERTALMQGERMAVVFLGDDHAEAAELVAELLNETMDGRVLLYDAEGGW